MISSTSRVTASVCSIVALSGSQTSTANWSRMSGGKNSELIGSRRVPTSRTPDRPTISQRALRVTRDRAM